MGKNPAFSFYYDDFIGGTSYMSHEEVGAYLRLLLDQFSKGHLSFDHIKKRLGPDWERLWNSISDKFICDSHDKYFNRKMDEVKAARDAYSKSRSENRKKKDISERHEKDMKNISEDMGIRNKEEEIGIRNQESGSGEENKNEQLSSQEKTGIITKQEPVTLNPLTIAKWASATLPGKNGKLHRWIDPNALTMPSEWGSDPDPYLWLPELQKAAKAVSTHESGDIAADRWAMEAAKAAQEIIPPSELWTNFLWYAATMAIQGLQICTLKNYFGKKLFTDDHSDKFRQTPKVQEIWANSPAGQKQIEDQKMEKAFAEYEKRKAEEKNRK